MYKPNDKVGQLKLAIANELIPKLPPIADGDYSLIVCDPPWSYNLRENDETHRGRCPYPNMSDEDILKMPIGAKLCERASAIASQDAYLILWTTNNHMPLSFRCLEQWGFKHKAVFTWVKTTKKHTSENPSPHIGVGHYGRNCTEHFLIGVKGNAGSFTSHGLTNITLGIFAPRGEHSKKPDEFWLIANRLAEKLGRPKIELFARERREGWDAWGAEVI